ncbi:MAG: 16S rRNA (guanine(966)-N(2))-methyltransferase RsmD [Chloroflexi bacterium]|nr:16S rRNA (guanine(966)-N(2))-methyltransferase RsmD [Chloroflexota bacterium]
MRVIAGEAKGKPLVPAKDGGTRSATDRIRETLFAILDPRLEGARVLDLFAGAGTLGIEALSRGASDAVFVERGARALAALAHNLERTGLGPRATLSRADVLSFLAKASGPFDLVLCDPPFADTAVLTATLAHPGLRGVLASDALVVVRIHKKHRPALPAGARVVREREVGEETLMFLEYDAA